ncbi:MAG: hypothetical protein ABSH41_29675 [Syntrophobacteraceae bacterium]|jgi:hypothetical protein
MNWDYDYANYVDEKGAKEIQELENKIGKTILAYPTSPVPAKLSEEDKERIESLEKKLCVRLVAYEKH